ncbi:hypothetical protein [Streptosporangium sp. NPDC002607]
MRWIVIPLTGIVLITLTACGASEEERFARSAESMEQVARTVKPDTKSADEPRQIGLFEFTSIYRYEDLVYFQLSPRADVDPYGYVWSPKGEPVDSPDDAAAQSFEHVQGPWYRWSESW